jgi:hypothetical protein
MEKQTMESRMGMSWMRKGLTVLGLAFAATIAIGASQANAQGVRFSSGHVEVYGGHGGYVRGGYRYPRRGVHIDVYRHRGHYDYHPGGVHYDRVYHPEYSHWTPLHGYHTHGHYDVVPHYTPGHFDYHHGGHGHGHFHH